MFDDNQASLFIFLLPADNDCGLKAAQEQLEDEQQTAKEKVLQRADKLFSTVSTVEGKPLKTASSPSSFSFLRAVCRHHNVRQTALPRCAGDVSKVCPLVEPLREVRLWKSLSFDLA